MLLVFYFFISLFFIYFFLDSSYTHLSEPTKLPKGEHSYNFRFRIPEHAPGSFTGSKGSVKYVLKAVVERQWKVDSQSRTVHVLSCLDLNHVPSAGVSLGYYITLFFKLGCVDYYD